MVHQEEPYGNVGLFFCCLRPGTLERVGVPSGREQLQRRPPPAAETGSRSRGSGRRGGGPPKGRQPIGHRNPYSAGRSASRPAKTVLRTVFRARESPQGSVRQAARRGGRVCRKEKSIETGRRGWKRVPAGRLAGGIHAAPTQGREAGSPEGKAVAALPRDKTRDKRGRPLAGEAGGRLGVIALGSCCTGGQASQAR